MYTEQDLTLIKKQGVSIEEINTQLESFRTGFPFLTIVSAASVGNGILRIDKENEDLYLQNWGMFLKSDKVVTKFVPASGAASRMFKDLFSFLESDYDNPTTQFEGKFFDEIKKFAFFSSLDKKCEKMYGKNVSDLCKGGKYKQVIQALLSENGLDYGNMPKGLLLFHQYPEGNRTPVGEHMTESVLYAKNFNNEVRIHFTVSEEHLKMFEVLVAARKLNYEIKLNTLISVSFSTQKPNTDTIAVDLNNEPFRENDGSLLFRPGGHGALIENLNDINSDIIFIKNIDNVVPDKYKENEAHYKKILAGVLVTLQKKAHEYLQKLASGEINSDMLNEILSFVEDELSIYNSPMFKSESELKQYLIRKLDRPFRVCGMVENIGEPGGGPFIVVNSDDTASPQILESSQIDKNNPKAVDAFNHGSHFNPVDLVCSVKCYKGNKFDLTKYVDKNTGFISQKSKNGKELKALELPGLWNGAMSDWNTIFVEVPVSTFNPVKTVNDLLRTEHQ